MPTERQIQLAFERGVSSITDDVLVGALRDALAAGDVQAVLDVIDIEDAAFDEFRAMLVTQFAESGAAEINGMKFKQPVRWNSANPRVEEYARNQVGDKITRMTSDMKVAVRNTVADGYAFGRSVNRMALDLVGRIGPSGKRQGGIVGLSSQQAGWVDGMRLALSGEGGAKFWIGADGKLKSTLTRRDRRFDAAILKSLKTGIPLTKDQIDNMTRAYANRLLLSRGKTIAKTERGQAVNAGRVEAWKQAADKLGLPYTRIRKQWVYTDRSRIDRPDHRAADKTQVQGLDTPFIVGGVPYLYPHDPSLAAENTINCSCECKIWLG